MHFNFFLCLVFIIGLLCVSAGAYIIIKIKHITDNIIFIGRVILAYMAKYVPPIKSNREVIKSAQELRDFFFFYAFKSNEIIDFSSEII